MWLSSPLSNYKVEGTLIYRIRLTHSNRLEVSCHTVPCPLPDFLLYTVILPLRQNLRSNILYRLPPQFTLLIQSPLDGAFIKPSDGTAYEVNSFATTEELL
jgi:hypothetical protein